MINNWGRSDSTSARATYKTGKSDSSVVILCLFLVDLSSLFKWFLTYRVSQFSVKSKGQHIQGSLHPALSLRRYRGDFRRGHSSLVKCWLFQENLLLCNWPKGTDHTGFQQAAFFRGNTEKLNGKFTCRIPLTIYKKQVKNSYKLWTCLPCLLPRIVKQYSTSNLSGLVERANTRVHEKNTSSLTRHKTTTPLIFFKKY